MKMPMTLTAQLAIAAVLLAAAGTALGQADARNVPLMPNGLPTDIDTLTRPGTDARPYAYQPPTVYGRPNAAPPYYERRYYGDRPTTLAPVPPDRSRDLTPFESRSLYGAPTPPRWDLPVRPVAPASRVAPKSEPGKPESEKAPVTDKPATPNATPP